MNKTALFSLTALIVCTLILLTACGTALSEVFLQLRGPGLLLGL